MVYIFSDPDDVTEFCWLMQMTPDTYGFILQRIAPLIHMKNITFRRAIADSERLSITLKYLAIGEQYIYSIPFPSRIKNNPNDKEKRAN